MCACSACACVHMRACVWVCMWVWGWSRVRLVLVVVRGFAVKYVACARQPPPVLAQPSGAAGRAARWGSSLADACVPRSPVATAHIPCPCSHLRHLPLLPHLPLATAALPACLLQGGQRAKLSDMGLSKQLVAEQSSFESHGAGGGRGGAGGGKGWGRGGWQGQRQNGRLLGQRGEQVRRGAGRQRQRPLGVYRKKTKCLRL